jgi:hypothetical protein
VRVARGRIEEPDKPVRLIIGFDGSKGAEAAVEAVAARKWPAGSEARIVNATWATPQITSNRGSARSSHGSPKKRPESIR